MENSQHPLALGDIRLDGDDTGLVHKIGDVDLIAINFGTWVEAVFSEEKKGDISNIKISKPFKY